MLGGKSFLGVKQVQKSAISERISESRFHEVLDEKDKEIARLTKTIKKLKKELKDKEQAVKVPVHSQGNNAYFKTILQKEVSRYNDLKELVVGITERIKGLSQEINSEFSIFQSNSSMENLVKMLDQANISGSRSGKSMTSERSSQMQDEQVQAEQVVDQFQIVVRGLMAKHGQITKMYKETINIQKQLEQDLKSNQKELKLEKKSKDLLQSLLQKSETQKNALINQINTIASKQEVEDLKSKSKEQILVSYFKLHYRIKDLEKEKQEYLRLSTKDKEKQVKLYQVLLSQVKNIKERQRSRQSVM